MTISEENNKYRIDDNQDVFVFPASYAQKRMWFLDQFEPGSPYYNIPVAFKIKGKFDKDLFIKTISKIIERHESLRTTFSEIKGQPFQVISPKLKVECPVIDLSGFDKEIAEKKLHSVVTQEARASFNLAAGPLFRVKILKLPADDNAVLITMHHIISDGWSMGILVEEITSIYSSLLSGKKIDLPELEIQYADFSEWQNKYLSGDILEKQLEYWKNKLGDSNSLLDLPLDRNRKTVYTNYGSSIERIISNDIISRLQKIANSENASLFMILVAAFNILLSRYSGQEDINIGTPIANRNNKDIERIIGLFINTLVIRTDLSGNPSFKELLRKVRRTILEAFEHQDLPFEILVDAIQPERNMSYAPLFQVMLILQNNPIKSTNLPEFEVSMLDVDMGTATSDITYSISTGLSGASCAIEYNTDLFDGSTIKRMFDDFETLLKEIINDPDERISNYYILHKDSLHKIINVWNSREQELPEINGIHSLFEIWAEKTPDNIAVVDDNSRITYRELNVRANKLARYLSDKSTKNGKPIAISQNKTVNLLASVLGVLKSGNSYLPLDPTYPLDRLNYMIEDSEIELLITDKQNEKIFSDFANKIIIDDFDEPKELSGSSLNLEIDGNDLAYIIYTSGSTGKAKGTMIQHNSLINIYKGWERDYGLLHDAKNHLQMASFSFDVFGGDWTRALCSGGKLVLVSREKLLDAEELYRLIVNENIDIAEFVPAVLRNLIEYIEERSNDLKMFKVLIAGSDIWYVKEYKNFIRYISEKTRLINSFGLTETAIDSTYFESRNLNLPDERLVPIGKPFPNVRLYILDKYYNILPIGVKGELFIEGISLARGYYKRPHLTAEKFIPNKYSKMAGDRLYSTGDLARYLPDGNIEFLGRSDNQVKLRGFRIELGEIENVLSEHDKIREAIVLVKDDQIGEKRLVAYVIVNESIDLSEITEFLSERVPDYMVPSAFMFLEKFPLTPNGKIDRKALPEPDQEDLNRTLEIDYLPPRNSTEEKICEIWSEILSLEKIGVTHNFFLLGGHSLLATQVVSRIKSEFKVDFPLRLIFEKPNIEEIALEIENLKISSGISDDVKIEKRKSDENIPLSFAQERLWFLDQLEPNSPFYNIPESYRIKGDIDFNVLEKCFNIIIKRHEILRTYFSSNDGTPVQIVEQDYEIKIPIIDLSDAEEQDEELKSLVDNEALTSISINDLPLFRIKIIKLKKDEFVFLMTIHHIISDDWSTNVIVQELGILYESVSNNLPNPLKDLSIQYADYAIWQRNWLQGDLLKSHLEFWKVQLSDIPSILELPYDKSRPNEQTFNGDYVSFHLSENFVKKLDIVSRQEGVTVFMIMLAVFKVVLYKLSGQSDIVVGTPSANRNRKDIETLIGFFVNTLALRTDCSGNPAFSDFLSRIKETTFASFSHQDLPFETIVDAIKPERNLSHSPIFQVMFVYQTNRRKGQETSGEISIAPVESHSRTAKFDLTLFMLDSEEETSGAFEYNTDLFEKKTIEKFIAFYKNVLKTVLEDVSEPIEKISLLDFDEQKDIVERLNSTEIIPEMENLVHKEFSRISEIQSRNIAVKFMNSTMSFGELEIHSNKLANYLVKLGIRSEEIVAICIPRSFELIYSLFGVLKTGAAYLPVDPKYPAERIDYILKDSQAKAVITNSRLASLFNGLDIEIILIDQIVSSLENENEDPPKVKIHSNNICYVIYTSGSTGQPKGTLLTHKGFANYLNWAKYAYPYNEENGSLVHSTVSFDATITSIFPPLLSGKNIVLMKESEDIDELANTILSNNKFSTLKITPAHLELLSNFVPADKAKEVSEAMIIGGENLISKQVEFWRRNTSKTLLFNEYGPTEAVVGCVVFEASKYNGVGSIPIGKVIPNMQVFVLDKNLSQVPVGVPGELYIGGISIARGYVNKPELTAGKFIPNPFSKIEGDRIYKSGDLVKILPDGNLLFLRRLDDQVKVRGYRIELGEIEMKLNSHTGIKDCVVDIRDFGEDDKRIIAYLVLENSDLDSISIKYSLKKELPDYMVPSYFMIIEKIPLTINGKIDRSKLPLPAEEIRLVKAKFISPATETERKVTLIWQEILKIEKIGVYDNFFDLGGHSLLVTKLAVRLENSFNFSFPMKDIFAYPTVAELSQRIDEGKYITTSNYKLPPLVKVPNKENIPLSYTQRRLWFLYQLDEDHAIYNMPMALRVSSNLDLDALRKTVDFLAERHETLRTNFIEAEGIPQQVINETHKIRIDINDLHNLPKSEIEERIKSIKYEEASIPFDLTFDALVRFKIIKTLENEFILFCTMHHIISDGWSTNILIREFIHCYLAFSENHIPVLNDLPVQYSDFAIWQQKYLTGDILDKKLEYWISKLKGSPPLLNLPIDKKRPINKTFNGSHLSFTLSEDLIPKIHAAMREWQITPFMFLIGVFKILLSRLSGQRDINVGTPIANRNNVETEGLIGFFANTLVFRSILRDETVGEFYSNLKNTAVDAFSNQDVPFEKLVEILNPERDMGHTPLFQVMFVLQDNETNLVQSSGNNIIEALESDSASTQYDLTLSMNTNSDEWLGTFEYNTDLFEEKSIKKFIESFNLLIEQIIKVDNKHLYELEFLSEEAKNRILQISNGSAKEYSSINILERFKKTVNQYPEKMACSYNEYRISYAELDKNSDRISNYLIGKGYGIEAKIAVMIPNSIELVEWMLGIMKAGCCYLPVDPDYPVDRIQYILDDSDSKILVVKDKNASSEEFNDIEIIIIHSDDYTRVQFEPVELSRKISADNLAYIIYTSGSTGRPKGVMLNHRGLLNLVENQIADFCLNEQSNVLQFASIGFDASISEIFMALASGSTLHLADRKILTDTEVLKEILIDKNVSIVTLPPSLLKVMNTDKLENLKTIISAGEKLTPDLFYKWKNGRDLINAYGPTESTVGVSSFNPQKINENWESIPIGRPISNVGLFILDGDLNIVREGTPGELFISGASLARGYINKPDLTAEKFIPNPYSKKEGERLYRTGDLVKFDEQGLIEYIGRIDDQVKLRGYRIELTEIESVLNSIKEIEQSAVITKGEGENARLVAFIKPAKDKEIVNDKIKNDLRKLLPEYMIPGFVLKVDEIPLTPSGKVDRKYLAVRSDLKPVLGNEYIPPKTEIEKQLVNIWQKLLGIDKIGIQDNFFELGGHSLLATQLTSRIINVFNVDFGLKSIFENPTLILQVNLIEVLSNNIKISKFKILKTKRPQNIPISFAQQRLWVLDKIEVENAVYNIPTALKLLGKVDTSIIELSLKKLIERHESLRTNFYEIDGHPYQKIHDFDNYDFKINQYDLSNFEKEYLENRIKAILQQESQFIFDLENDQLFRFSLIKITADEHIISFVFHHIIVDGWSINLLLNEFSEIYYSIKNNLPFKLLELPFQYADFSIWQRGYLEGGILENQLKFWKQKLKDSPQELSIPIDKQRPKIKTFNGDKVELSLSKDIKEQINRISSSERLTPFMIFISVFNLLLSKYSGQKDINIGVPIANRNQFESEQIVGFFANTIVIRTLLDDNPKITDLFKRVKNTSLEAFNNQDIPFEQIVENIQPERNLSHSPLFQVMFVLQNNPKTEYRSGDLRIEPVENHFNLTQYEVTLSAEENPSGYTFWMEYNTDLFNKNTIETMLGKYVDLLQKSLNNPNKRVSEFPLIDDPNEYSNVLELSRGKIQKYDQKNIIELFEIIVKKKSNNIALVENEKKITFDQLNIRSNQIANYLLSRNVVPEETIAVMLPSGIDLITFILGIMKSGCNYLPIDINHPEERKNYLLFNSSVKKIITKDEIEIDGYSILTIDEIYKTLESLNIINLKSKICDENLAYMIYTSGSTGTPKGVMLTHKGLLNLVQNQIKDFRIVETDKILQFASLSFDASISEIFMALISGAQLYLIDDQTLKDKKKLLDFIDKNEISVITLPPSFLTLLEKDDLKNIRTIITAGETLSRDISLKWNKHANLFNAYGPTESTVGVSAFKVDNLKEYYESTPIGTPIDNVGIFILDEELNVVPKNVIGNIYISGDSLSRGYVNNPKLTSESFIPNPFSNLGDRLYKTGDKGKFNIDGIIEFTGRADSQVKFRGFRIELEEIEIVLRKQENIKDAVVQIVEKNNNKFLTGFLLTNRSFENEYGTVRSHLLKYLPDYMVPNLYIEVKEFPKNNSGKIDRKKLFEMIFTTDTPKKDFVKPKNKTEVKLVKIWEDLLGIKKISINDNFFELGGHSLLAIQLIGKISKEFNVDLEMIQLFQDPTIQSIAKEIEKHSSNYDNIDKILVEFSLVKETNPIFFIHPSGGSVHWYSLLANEFKDKQTFYGIQALGIGGKIEPQKTIQKMAETYIDAIKKVKPKGPYIVGSWSMGVVIAYEIANQLVKNNEVADPLIILDQGPEIPNDEPEDTAEFLIRMFMGRVIFDVKKLRKLSYDDQLKFVLKKAKKEKEFPRFITFNRFKNYVKILKIQQDAWRQYQIPIVKNDLVLVKAKESSYDFYNSEQYGWEKYVDGKINIFEIEGNHNTILHKQHIGKLANLIYKIINKRI